jgi:SAM-dependent methyltransferase
MADYELPTWGLRLLECPATGATLQLERGRIVNDHDQEVARIEDGVIRFPVQPDEGIRFHRNIGGPRFFERSVTPFAMSALDTPIYHAHLNEMLQADPDAVIVDVGGGDGRNAIHCLRRGFRRVVLIDVVGDALLRFRNRVAEQNSDWLDLLLLIEADARRLPMSTSCAQAVFAIESLAYLNEDYEIGLRECARVLAPSGKLLVSERDYEGGLVLRLLYHGVNAMLGSANTRSLWDGRGEPLVRSRTFTQTELVEICQANGLEVFSVRGMSLLPLLLGYLNGRGLLSPSDVDHLPQVHQLLARLAETGVLRRCHVVMSQKSTKN